MNYWLVKSEPDAYSYDDLVRDKQTFWDGVRNYAARNHMKNMKKGDLVLYYHSVSDKSVVGIAKVVKEYYQDPTTDDDRWVAVDLKPEKKLKKPVTLNQIKAEKMLEDMPLVRIGRLSVMPVKPEEYDKILEMSES